MFKVKQDLNKRLSPDFTFTESKRKGLLLKFKKKEKRTWKDNTFFRGPVVWIALDIKSRNLEKLAGCFKAALKQNKAQLNNVSFDNGTLTNYNNDLTNYISILLTCSF